MTGGNIRWEGPGSAHTAQCLRLDIGLRQMRTQWDLNLYEHVPSVSVPRSHKQESAEKCFSGSSTQWHIQNVESRWMKAKLFVQTGPEIQWLLNGALAHTSVNLLNFSAPWLTHGWSAFYPFFQAVNQQTLHSKYGGWQWRRILHSKNWNFTGRLRQRNYHKFPVRLRHLAIPHFKKPNKIIRWSRSEILVGETGNLNTEMSRCRQRPLGVKPGVFHGALC